MMVGDCSSSVTDSRIYLGQCCPGEGGGVVVFFCRPNNLNTVKFGYADDIALLALSLQNLRLKEFYSYTEKNQQKRTRKTKQNKGKLCTANNYIQ